MLKKLLGLQQKEEILIDKEEIINYDVLSNFRYIGTYGKKQIFEANARQLINNSSMWSLNRPLDHEHVNQIYHAMLFEKEKTNKITMFGSLSFFYDKKKDTLSQIDGMHRITALQRILDNDKTISINLVIDVYTSEDETDNKLIELFSTLNHVKPQLEETLPTKEKETLLHKILSYYNKKFECIKEKRCQRPCIEAKVLMDWIHENIKEKTYEEIIELLDEINIKFSRMSMKDIFKNELIIKRESCNIFFKKAEQKGFWLGMRQKKKNGCLDWDDMM